MKQEQPTEPPLLQHLLESTSVEELYQILDSEVGELTAEMELRLCLYHIIGEEFETREAERYTYEALGYFGPFVNGMALAYVPILQWVKSKTDEAKYHALDKMSWDLRDLLFYDDFQDWLGLLRDPSIWDPDPLPWQRPEAMEKILPLLPMLRPMIAESRIASLLLRIGAEAFEEVGMYEHVSQYPEAKKFPALKEMQLQALYQIGLTLNDGFPDLKLAQELLVLYHANAAAGDRMQAKAMAAQLGRPISSRSTYDLFLYYGFAQGEWDKAIELLRNTINGQYAEHIARYNKWYLWCEAEKDFFDGIMRKIKKKQLPELAQQLTQYCAGETRSIYFRIFLANQTADPTLQNTRLLEVLDALPEDHFLQKYTHYKIENEDDYSRSYFDILFESHFKAVQTLDLGPKQCRDLLLRFKRYEERWELREEWMRDLKVKCIQIAGELG